METFLQTGYLIVRRIKYYFLSVVLFLISFIGFYGLKLIIVLLILGIATLAGIYVDDFGIFIGLVIGLLAGVLLFKGFEHLYPYFERLDNYSKKFKEYTYTELYGKDYPQPKPEDYGISLEEFKSYNNRFQFEYIKLLFTYGTWIVSSIYVIRENTERTNGFLIVGGSVLVSIFFNYIFKYMNKRISQKHPYYDKIHDYQKACDVYRKIKDENYKI
ncbi:MAG: hypothetical protein F9K23_01475 [Bacteroidetes bacterium]|nr:MAG: hypothetical protein F9K23_01475 [Bacteroidota bacterium]